MRIGTRSIDGPRLLLGALVMVTATTMVVAGTTSTAAFGSYNPNWEGTSNLRSLAEESGAETATVTNVSRYATIAPENAVSVILSPDEPYTDSEVATIRRFVRSGGTLVIAEDFGEHTNPLLAGLGARSRIDGRLLRDDRHYDRVTSFPIAGNVSDHPVARNVTTLTLNHGTAISPNGSRSVVRTSEFAYLDGDNDGIVDTNETLGRYPVVTVESIGEGQVVVIVDPSLFINAMLDRPDNRAFAVTLLAEAQTVLLDVSHAESVPPLTAMVISLRRSAPASTIAGLAGIAVIVLAVHRPDLLRRLQGSDPEVEDASRSSSPATIATLLERRYPGISPESVRGLVTAFKVERDDEDGNG